MGNSAEFVGVRGRRRIHRRERRGSENPPAGNPARCELPLRVDHALMVAKVQPRRPSNRVRTVGKKLVVYVVMFVGGCAVPLWLGWSSVQDCTAAGNNFYSCSAAALVRGDIKIAGKVMLAITLGRQGS